MAGVEFSLLPHQKKFVLDPTRYLALVAGYGSGKTHVACAKAIYLAFVNQGQRGAMLEPTNAMCVDVLVPGMTQFLIQYNIPFRYRASPYPSFFLPFNGGVSSILIRSAENYTRLAGLNLAWFIVDEIDTIAKRIAIPMWRMLESRLRARAKLLQGCGVGTPEGFGFFYEYFVKEVRDKAEMGISVTNRTLHHASTYDNPFLEEQYIQALLESYPPNLVDAYLHGKFVNLLSETVYYSFNRHTNNSDVTKEQLVYTDNNGEKVYPQLHIGLDFNVGKCCAIVHVIRSGKPIAIEEITKQKNTEAMIATIKKRYSSYPIVVYPDASAKAEKTNASVTDLALLRDARFTIVAERSNPLVKDRVGSMNAMFCNAKQERNYTVNVAGCPVYVEALETQAYDKTGQPDKQHDQDHPVDASGYFIHKKFPTKHKPHTLRLVGL